MSPYNHLSSKDILKLAEENIQKADARGITPKMFALIGIGQALIIIARELRKYNSWLELGGSPAQAAKNANEGKEAK